MNVLDGQWMSRVTSHVSLREALDQITPSASRRPPTRRPQMRKAGIEKPRIAVAALNPHAGENGLFGREEIEILPPAVEERPQAGIDCKGPFPADTVYIRAFAGDYDSVVSMYHDQGQIATKLKGFNRGVTMTAGLDTVFTTPAHGTAFDIVGKGVAKTGASKARSSLPPPWRGAGRSLRPAPDAFPTGPTAPSSRGCGRRPARKRGRRPPGARFRSAKATRRSRRPPGNRPPIRIPRGSGRCRAR